MPDKHYLQNVIVKMAEMVALTFGKNCEVIVRDLASREIVAIFNGEISGRAVGHKIPETMTHYLKNMTHSHEEMFVNLADAVHNGHQTKSSTLLIPDMNGHPVFEVCINFNIDSIVQARDSIEALTELITTKPYDFQESVQTGKETSKQSINEYTLQLISTVSHSYQKPFNKNNRTSKLKLLRELDEKGVFIVRDSVAIVCDVLEISQATLYNYLREIREDKST
jgi:predicted transcriptional regulator YheO